VEFGWSTQQQERFTRTIDAVRQALPDGDRTGGHYDRKDWLKLGELGLLGMPVPVSYGGGGFGAVDTARLTEAFGYACADTGLVFAAGAHLFACTVPITEYGTEQAKSRLLPGLCSGQLIAGNAMTEEGAGSDVSKLAVTATPTAGGWALSGEKSFVSNGPAADILVTYATTDPRAGHLGCTAFVVDATTPGVVAGKSFEKMGLSSCPAGTVRFEDCLVPSENMLGVPGQGGAIFQHSMAWERSCLFAGYVGLMDRLVERSVAHARTRRQFGQPIGDFESVANRIADMKLRAEAGRLLLYRACWEIDQSAVTPMSIALAKLAVSEGALASALDAVRLFGAQGYLAEYGIEATLRDTVPATIFSGTSDIQRMIIVKELGL
jgi:alkylation response protein AidB-like acyl-CoA dehydrogenase